MALWKPMLSFVLGGADVVGVCHICTGVALVVSPTPRTSATLVGRSANLSSVQPAPATGARMPVMRAGGAWYVGAAAAALYWTVAFCQTSTGGLQIVPDKVLGLSP